MIDVTCALLKAVHGISWLIELVSAVLCYMSSMSCNIFTGYCVTVGYNHVLLKCGHVTLKCGHVVTYYTKC